MYSTIPPVDITSSGRLTRYMDTTTAYDLWSKVYDKDGNILQALDTIEMQSLLPKTLSQISTPQPWKLVDLGCGTGRHALQLLKIPHATIIGVDASPKMLEIAKSRLDAHRALLEGTSNKAKGFETFLFDMLASSQVPASAMDADALLSTLVLEHIPLYEFFQACSQILRPGGLALITNMHSEMGAISQAGFVDPKTGEKVRPQSFAHRLEDVVGEAQRQGFEVVGEILEKRVDEEMSRVLGARAKKWIGVMVWFGVCFRKQL